MSSVIHTISRMSRGILALGCCALYLAFGFTAGVAHVHRAADHHDQSRSVHLDHAHVTAGPGEHRHEVPRDGMIDVRHVGHHEGDAVYLDAAALHVPMDARVLPAVVSAPPAVDRPVVAAEIRLARPSRPRDPPAKIPPRFRAPPVRPSR